MSPKTGRNDPCPCGSGQKYKRCCLPREEAARLKAAREPELWDLDDDDDDDGYLDEDDLFDPFGDEEPIDLELIESVRYERGFVTSLAQAETGEGLRATEWAAPDIPAALLAALKAEGADGLGGVWGDPRAGTPIETDIIALSDGITDFEIEIYNRGILLLSSHDDAPKRLHRICGALEAAAGTGRDVPAGTPAMPPMAEPLFTLDGLDEIHRKQPGRCELCGETVTSRGASRHLAACAPSHEAGGPPHDLLHLRVVAPGQPGYWLDIEVRADARLTSLDRLLRDRWLECCGHLSSFRVGDVAYWSSVEELAGGMDVRRMSTPVGKALAGVKRFTYEYDFGSTTELALEVRGARAGRLERTPARVLAANAPLEWPCAVCGAPASLVCPFCLGEEPNPFVCAGHAGRHECDVGEAFLPVVNSPRMGVCGYGDG